MFTCEAPAKINLSLRVLRRREDGFHEIATRMAPLELADMVTVHSIPAPDGTVHFTCDDPTVPADESNLAVKAVRALEQDTGPLPAVLRRCRFWRAGRRCASCSPASSTGSTCRPACW